MQRWFRILGGLASTRSGLEQYELWLGSLRAPTIIHSLQYGGFFSFELVVTAQPAQLMALKAHRNVGDVAFEIKMSGIDGHGNVPNDDCKEQFLPTHVADPSRSGNGVRLA